MSEPIEYPLKPDSKVLEPYTYNVVADNFWHFVKIGTAFAGPMYEEIPFSELYGLRSHLNLTGLEDKSFITVLRIFYGVDNDENLKFIFLPDTATIVSDSRFAFGIPSQSSKYTKSQLIGNTCKVYYWDGASMVETSFYDGTDNCPKAWVKKYQDNVELDKNADGAALTPFQYNGTRSDDSRGDTFSFQILKNFFDNLEDHIIYVTHTMSFKMTGPGINYFYHCVAFANTPPVDPEATPTVGALANKAFSDLGTLCPVRCNDIEIVNGYIQTLAIEPGRIDEFYNLNRALGVQ